MRAPAWRRSQPSGARQYPPALCDANGMQPDGPECPQYKAAPRLPFYYAPRFLDRERRNAIPNRVSQLIDRADQFLVGAHMGERPFAERTYQNFKQTFIHEFSP